MNINIYYGGRGIIEDPTLYVLKLIENVLDELHVKFTRYNLYELKNTITTLPQILPPRSSHALVSIRFASFSPYVVEITTGNIYKVLIFDLSP